MPWTEGAVLHMCHPLTLFSVLNSNQSNIFLYCVKTNRITVKAWFELTIRGGVHTIFFRIRWLKFRHLDLLRAKKRQTLSRKAQNKKLLNYIQLAEKYALGDKNLFFSHSHVNQPKTASKRRIWSKMLSFCY